MAATTRAQRHQLPPVREFRLTVGARPMQDGTVEVTVGPRVEQVETGAAALGLIVAYLTGLVGS